MKDRMLVAIGVNQSGCVLGYEGDKPDPAIEPDKYPDCRIGFELKEFSYSPEDHFKEIDLPERPGLYVWEGHVRYIDYGDGECDVRWDGLFRPAAVSDLRHFKIPPIRGLGLVYKNTGNAEVQELSP